MTSTEHLPDGGLPADDDLDDLIRPLSGVDWWRTGEGGGVPAIKVTDGPGGARGELFAGGPRSACFPCGAALGATWDEGLIEQAGAALAQEARAKGAHVLLAPTVNLQRTPLGGRHFECLSEDPMLTARLASAYVRGLQAEGVAACIKHFVANDAETDRFEISSDVDERTLRELYLLPFEHALRGAQAWSAMAAYNRVNGERATEHRGLLTTILRDEWGWDGAVISDWFATRSSAPSVQAGLDIEMPGPALHYGATLLDDLRSGRVERADVERLVERVRLLAERTGAFHRPPGPDGTGGHPAVAAVVTEVARQAVVLLRNEPAGDGPALPLDPASIGTIAVIGPNADREVIQGGGSARVTPLEVTTVLDGMRAVFGAEQIRFERGCRNDRGTPSIDGHRIRRADGTPGADIEVVDSDGNVRLQLAPRELRAVFLAEPWPNAGTGWTMRATCTYLPEVDGEHRFKVRTNTEARIFVGGQEGEVHDLGAGEPVELRVEAVPSAATALRAALEVRCQPPASETSIERAVAAARAASAAVVVIGLDHEWETEGRDRDDLSLPGDQVALVRAVVAAQPRTAVVVLAGSPVDLSWAAEVPAVLWGWYPGQGGGQAIAEVLAGVADPGGRLPCTMPSALEQTPAHLDVPPDPGHLRYGERIFVGHRWFDAHGIEPAFPFGHGLSYASFEMSPPAVAQPAVDAGDDVRVDVTVRNTSTRTGTEVVQLYLGGDRPGPARHPVRSLRAFAKVTLDPGEEQTVTLTLGPRDLAWWDEAGQVWRAEQGTYEVVAGRSSRHLAGSATFELRDAWTAPASWWR